MVITKNIVMKKVIPNARAMKRIFSIVAIASIMVACNSKPKVDATNTANPVVVLADTTGLAEYQAWKAQNELANMEQYKNMQLAANQSNNTRTYTPARKTSRSS